MSNLNTSPNSSNGLSLPSAHIMERVAQFLRDRQINAYLVGGTVRDQLLGRAETRDLDISVAGDASLLARAFADSQHGAFYLMDAEHNVARAILGSTYVDFAALRGTVQQDLSKRDFTVNAMARSLGTGEIVDPFGGRDDLSHRLIRVVSPTVFEDDPVRLLRAIRLSGELGFVIQPVTLDLMRHSAPLLERASMERVRDELFKILASDNAAGLVRQLDECGLAAFLLPELTALKGVTQSPPHIYDAFEHSLQALAELVGIQTSAYFDVANGNHSVEIRRHLSELISAERSRGLLLRLTTLIHDIGKAATRSVGDDERIHFIGHEDRGAALAEDLFRRLRLSRSEIDVATRIIREHLRPPQLARQPDFSPRAVYRFFRAAGDEVPEVCVLALADTRAKAADDVRSLSDEQLRSTLTTLLDHYYDTFELAITAPSIIDGRALMQALHLPAGPTIGRLLESIREAQAVGEVKTREQALEFARHLLDGQIGYPET